MSTSPHPSTTDPVDNSRAAAQKVADAATVLALIDSVSKTAAGGTGEASSAQQSTIVSVLSRGEASFASVVASLYSSKAPAAAGTTSPSGNPVATAYAATGPDAVKKAA